MRFYLLFVCLCVRTFKASFRNYSWNCLYMVFCKIKFGLVLLDLSSLARHVCIPSHANVTELPEVVEQLQVRLSSLILRQVRGWSLTLAESDP